MAEGLAMTSGEKLLEQGRERGRAEGKLEGKLEGQLETAIDSLLLILEAREIVLSEAQRVRVENCRDLETLSRWMQAAATAESADVALR